MSPAVAVSPIRKEQISQRASGQWLKSGFVRQLVFVGAAIISVAYQGFEFGVNNNALQVPILQISGNPALYPGDPFIATLHNYFSIVWGILAAMHLRIDWAPVFLFLQIVSRYLMAVAFDALLADYLSDARARMAGAALLCNCAALFTFSPIGRHTMLIDYFEHTSLANALILFSCAMWLRRRYGIASVLLGLTFDVNAFVGAWGIAAFVLASLWRRDSRFKARVARLLRNLPVFLACAAPGITWLCVAMKRNAAAHAAPFDYRQFLRGFASAHFFINVASAGQIVAFAMIVASGAIAIAILGRNGADLARLGGAFIAVFVAGTFLPLFTKSPTLLNLHALRVDGIVQFLACAALVAACFRTSPPFGDPPVHSRVAVVAGLLIGSWPLILISSAALFTFDGPETKFPRRRLVGLLLILSAMAALIFPHHALELASGSPVFQQSNAIVTIGAVLALVILAMTNSQALAAPFAALAGCAGAGQFHLGALVACLTLLPALVEIRYVNRVRLAGSVLAVLAMLAQLARLLKMKPDTTNEILLAAGAFALVWPIAVALRKRHDGLLARTKPVSGSAFAFAAAALVLGVPVVAIQHAAAGELTRIRPRSDDPWRNVQEWAKHNTAPGTVFLVPLHDAAGFEVFSERSAWVDLKRASAIMWSPPYYWTWKQRWQEQTDATDAHAFGTAHGVCYAVTLRDDPARTLPHVKWPDPSLHRVYQNNLYDVLSLCDSVK